MTVKTMIVSFCVMNWTDGTCTLDNTVLVWRRLLTVGSNGQERKRK